MPPEPLIAGLLDAGGGSDEARSAALARPLSAEAVASGPLVLAVRGAHLHDGSTVCALDGSIYNLAGVAQGAGVAIEGPPATILAAAYARLGDELPGLLRGDFVLVAWDPARGRGVVARDQLGGRGLVWTAAGGRLLFASEVRHLLAVLGRAPGPDPAALAHWLAVSGMPQGRSLYEGVRTLRAGHLLALDGDRFELRRYWTPRYRSPLRAPRPELAAELRSRLEEAVGRRSVAGAETGVMLSGGLDSATVAAVGSRLQERARPARAYSAVFPRHPSIDESELIALLGERFGLSRSQVIVRGGSVLAGALPYLEHWRVPPVSPNLFFWLPLLRRAAADGSAVMLDGEGGDELFGLSPALIADRLRRGRLLAAGRLIYRIPGADGRPSRASVRRIFREHGLKAATPLPVHRAVRRLRGARTYAPDWLLDPAARAYADTDDLPGWKRLSGPRWWAYLVDLTTSGMGPALVYDHVRRRAALAGIETRHPLVDVDVVELVLQLPPQLAFDPRHSRPLLRQAMAGLIPDEVRLRSTKSTFDALFHECLAGPDLPVVRELLGNPAAHVGEYVDLAVVRERLLAPPPPEHPVARMHWALYTWRLLTAELWLRSLADPGFVERLTGHPGLRELACELVSAP